MRKGTGNVRLKLSRTLQQWSLQRKLKGMLNSIAKSDSLQSNQALKELNSPAKSLLGH